MIDVGSIYEDVADVVNKNDNGTLDYGKFNRMSRRAELRLLDILTGDITGQRLPAYFSNQKTKDWLANFITPYKTTLDIEGQFERPENYYYYDNMYSLTLEDTTCDEVENCEDLKIDEIRKNVIILLNGDRFNQRKNTYIKLLKPTPEKAIAKEIGKSFEVYPSTLAGVVLDYVRVPVFAEIKTTLDVDFDIPVIAPNSINYEWDESCREALIYLISDSFFNNVSDISGKQMSNASNQTTAGK